MKKINYILIILLILMSVEYSNAQDYKTALGLRLGASNGVTIKHFLNPGAAIEGLIATRWDGILITGLYEFAGNAFDEPNLGWYIGGGAHVGVWNSNNRHWRRYSRSIFGVDFILGLEYTFEGIPLNLALDWKPAVNFIGDHGFWGDEFALSIRFVIK